MEHKPKKKNKVLPIILALIVTGSAIYGINKYLYSRHHEDTDDAQVDADMNPVLSRVTGYVEKVNFEDNQRVNKGDTLVIIDNRDFLLKVEQAKAALDNADAAIDLAKSGTGTGSGNVKVAQSAVDAAQIRVNKLTTDFKRYENLIGSGSVTQQQYDAAKADKESAESALLAAQRQLDVAKSNSSTANQQVNVAGSQRMQRLADLDYAKLQLSYTVIVAPATGTVSKKTIQPGQLVSAGFPLCAIVSSDSVYVTANFKETQLEKMKEGQDVEIEADAYPDMTVDGKVYRFSAATGAKFSLLPPDNATGNFVKVVQRIPVKIKLGGNAQTLAKLRPGMSTRVSVHVD